MLLIVSYRGLFHCLNVWVQYKIEQLLVHLIPKKYFESIDVLSTRNIQHDLVVAFRLSFVVVSEDTKKRVLKKFIKNIKEESSNIEWRYTFFKGEDLQYCLPEEVTLIKEHFLSIFKAPINTNFLTTITGIGRYLSHSELIGLVYPYVNSLAVYQSHYENDEIKKLIENFQEEYMNMFFSTQAAIAKKFREILKQYNEQEAIVSAVKAICKGLISLDEPSDSLSDLDEHPF